MDILFKGESYVFSYRVSGIIIQDNKILLQKPENDDGFSFIGGHIAFGETAEEAIIREYKEETGIDIIPERLFAVGEVFFPWGKKPCHQLSLYYMVKPLSPLPSEDIFTGVDCLENKKFKLSFHRIALKDLSGIKLYPKEILPYLLNNDNKIHHFVSRQL